MAIVTGLTKERMLEIEAASIVSGQVEPSGHLILEKRDGTQIDAGLVKGADATALLNVSDTPSIDLTLSGAGVPGDPWVLSAKTNEIYPNALLDPTYRGPGPAKVIFLPGSTLSTESYQWLGKYERWGNPVVNMVRRGDTWAILGHSSDEGFGGKIQLERGSNWDSYNVKSGTNHHNEAFRAQRLISGIVVLSGLAMPVGAATDGQLIAKLPPGYRPDTDSLFPVLNSGNSKIVRINANGDIVVYDTNWIGGSDAWVSLDGIAFPAAGVANWIDIGSSGSSFQAGTTAVFSGVFGTPAFWKDPYGVVWFRGVIHSGTYTADAAMVHLPTGYGSHKQSHVLTGAGTGAAGGTGFGFVSVFPGGATNNKIAWKNGTVGSGLGASWISLAGLTVITDDALTALSWFDVKLGNGWASYGSTWPSPQVVRRPDGLGMSKGLLQTGTAAVNIGNFTDFTAPEKVALLSTVGADTQRRFDLYGSKSAGVYAGELRAVGTVTAWQSLDGLKWMIGD